MVKNGNSFKLKSPRDKLTQVDQFRSFVTFRILPESVFLNEIKLHIMRNSCFQISNIGFVILPYDCMKIAMQNGNECLSSSIYVELLTIFVMGKMIPLFISFL